MINRDSEQFLLDSYTGKGGYLPANGSYLLRHPRELDDKFENRREAAVYPNYVKKIVNSAIGFLWKTTPNRDTDSDIYTRFVQNAGGGSKKKSLNYLLTSFQRLALIVGTVYIIVDKSDKVATSKADERLPHIVARTPAQLVEETFDDDGEWTSITFKEVIDGVEQYRYLTAEGWILSADKERTQILRSGEYKLGSIPVVKLHATPPLFEGDSKSESWVHDIALLNWQLFNLCSELRELERSQTFSLFVLPVGDSHERESIKKDGLVISTENAILFNPASGGKPEFVAPPAEPANHYMAQIANVIVEIYKLANLEFVGGVQQSGVSLGFHFQAANSTFAIMSDMCEQAEREIAGLVMAWYGQEFTGTISYPREFNISDISQSLKVAMDSLSMDISPTFEKEIKKQVAHKLLASDVSAAVMQTIDDEIGAGSDPYAPRIAAEAAGEV